MKKEELVSGLLWDLSPHGRLSMRAGRYYIKKKKKNKRLMKKRLIFVVMITIMMIVTLSSKMYT